MKKTTFKRAKPFGAHNRTRLSNVNSKLVCALSTVSCDSWSDCTEAAAMN